MDKAFFKGISKGIEIVNNFDRKNKIKGAHELAKAHKCQDALDILESLYLSPNEKSVANLAGYLLKAVCYAELGYNQSALNSINVILSMSRWTINPYYHSVLKDSKKMALEIKNEFNL